MNIASAAAIKQLRQNVGCLEFLYPAWCRSMSTKVSGKLVDMVADDQLDINMNRYTFGKRRFDYMDERIVPPSVRGSNQRSPETLAVMATKIHMYKETNDGEIRKDAIRLMVRYFKPQNDEQRKRLEDDLDTAQFSQSKVMNRLEEFGVGIDEVRCWVECIRAKTTLEAIQAMDGQKWPQFLLRFTMRRECESRSSVHQLTRLFQSQFHQLENDAQMDCFLKLIRSLQLHLTDFLPGVCDLFNNEANMELRNSFTYNQILWTLAKFGKTWSDHDARNVANAQRMIVQHMVKHGILVDTKGYLGMAYLLKDMAPDKARVFVNAVKDHDYQSTDEERWALDDKNLHTHRFGTFVYRYGVKMMDMLLAEDEATVYTIMADIPVEKRNSAIWATAVQKLNSLGVFHAGKARNLWRHVVQQGFEITPFLVHKFLDGNQNIKFKRRLISEAKRVMSPNKTFSIRLLALEKQYTHRVYNAFNKSAKSLGEFNAMLRNHLRGRQREKMWSLYQELLETGHEPSSATMECICQAATRIQLQWDGLFATQRAVVEMKTWVRGAHADRSDVDDMSKCYPTAALFHWYIIVLGKAGYYEQLLDVIPWMERLDFVPDENCLCALIHFSPNGPYLLRHGQTVAQSGTNPWPWPTRTELEAYRYNLRHSLNLDI